VNIPNDTEEMIGERLAQTPAAPAGARARRVVAAIVIGILPVAVVIAMAAWLFGASPARAIPYVGDEVAYWLQIASFQAAGFDGGYATIEEQASQVSFSHFGPHGPAYAVLFGSIARVVGWNYWSGPAFSAVFLVLAIAAWVLSARPPLVAASLFMATFWPLLLAVPNTLEESLHGAVACAIAALLVRLPSEETETDRRMSTALLGLVIVASLIRPLWALLAIPLGGRWGRPGQWKFWAGTGAGAVFAASMYSVYTLLASPYRGPSGGVLLEILSQPLTVLPIVLHRQVAQFEAWFAWRDQWFEILFRYELMALGLAAAVLAMTHHDPRARLRLVSAAAMSALVLLSVLTFINIGSWRDYRMVTPIVLLLWLLIASVRPRALWVAIAIHLLVAPIGARTFADFQEPRFHDDPRPAIDAFASEVRGVLAYDRSLPPWGNSVLVHLDAYQFPLLGLPKGIGVSMAFEWDKVAVPFKSRYLLLRPADVDALAGIVRMRKLRDTSLGALYENLDWRR
jgi:hypothetical protein